MVTVLSMLRLPIACLVEVKLAYHVDPFPFIRFPVQYVLTSFETFCILLNCAY